MSKEKEYRRVAKELVDNFDPIWKEKLKNNIDLTNSKYEPFWKAKNELAKNIISLGSATLVLTITFSETFLENSEIVKILLFLSWGSLLVSILCGFLSLNFGMSVKKHLWNFYFDLMKKRSSNKSIDSLKETLQNSIPESEIETVSGKKTGELMASVIPKLIELSAPGIQKLNLDGKDWQLILLQACFIFFITALLILGVIGWFQFAG